MKYSLSVFFIFFVLNACQQKSAENLADYYYPLNELTTGKTYVFHPTSNERLPPHIWVYSTEEKDGKTYFNGKYYDVEGELKQVVREEKTDGLMLAVSYSLFDKDSTGTEQQSKIEIMENAVYPLAKEEMDKVHKFKIAWTDPLDRRMHNSLTRGRIFQRFSSYKYQGKEVPCAEFLMVETIEVEQEGQGSQTLETETRELFAKGIGLVYYRKMVGEMEIEYELVEIKETSTILQ